MDVEQQLRSPLVNSEARPNRVPFLRVAMAVSGFLGIAAVCCFVVLSDKEVTPATATNQQDHILESLPAMRISSSIVDAQDLYADADVEAFNTFRETYERDYNAVGVTQAKFETFQENAKKAAALNDADDDAEYGVTRFSDMSEEEFSAQYLSNDMSVARDIKPPMLAQDLPTDDLPESFDWRDHKAVTSVKDQSSCGSCWAFSAAGDIEGQWFLANNTLTDLSVEHIIECDTHNAACYGGFPSKAFQWIIENKGVAAEKDYPYNVDGHVICLANQTFNYTMCPGDGPDDPCTYYCDLTCRADAKPVAHISSWEAVSEDEDQIAAYLVKNGPLSVAFNANWAQFYKKGIMNPWMCSPKTLNHAVLLVGFGEEKGKKYWTVKNSWASKWGEDGYFRIMRGVGKCGINTLVTSSKV